jgi:hypothetical protein
MFIALPREFDQYLTCSKCDQPTLFARLPTDLQHRVGFFIPAGTPNKALCPCCEREEGRRIFNQMNADPLSHQVTKEELGTFCKCPSCGGTKGTIAEASFEDQRTAHFHFIKTGLLPNLCEQCAYVHDPHLQHLLYQTGSFVYKKTFDSFSEEIREETSKQTDHKIFEELLDQGSIFFVSQDEWDDNIFALPWSNHSIPAMNSILIGLNFGTEESPIYPKKSGKIILFEFFPENDENMVEMILQFLQQIKFIRIHVVDQARLDEEESLAQYSDMLEEEDHFAPQYDDDYE